MDTLLALADEALTIDTAKAELIQQVMLTLMGIMGTVVMAFLTWAGNSMRKWITAKSKGAESNARLQAFLCATTKMETIFRNAYLEVEQTLVRQLKADESTWNSNTARHARDTAVEIGMRHLGEQGVAELSECMGHAPEVIEGIGRTLIEGFAGDRTDSKDAGPVVGLGRTDIEVHPVEDDPEGDGADADG